MRLSALLWLGLAALHQSVNADQVGNPVSQSRDASGWQGPYQPPRRLPQWRRPQPYQPIIQQVPIVQPSPSIRQRPVRPFRPVSHQPYVPRMVNDARVVEPYKPVMMNGVVVQPYRPQMSAPMVEPYKPVVMDGVVVQPYRPQVKKDMLVQLLPTRGNRFVGLQTGQQAYEEAINKMTGDSITSSVNQSRNVEGSYVPTQAVVQEKVIAPSALPSITEAAATIPSCSHSTTPLPQVATQTASSSVDASVSAALPTLSSEAIDLYDDFQIAQEPIVLDAARLVQPYQPTIEDELAQPDIFVPGNVMVHEYLPTLEDAQMNHEFALSDGGLSRSYRPVVEVEALELQPYHQNSNLDILSSYSSLLDRKGSADVPATLVLSPYRPTLQDPAQVDTSATGVRSAYRPMLEGVTDVSATMLPPPYRPTLEESVDVDASTTMVPPPYRPMVQEFVDVDVSATMLPPPYRPTLEESVDADASTTMVSPPYRPMVQKSVDVDASTTMVPPQDSPTLKETVHQPNIPDIEKSRTDVGKSAIDSIQKTSTSDEKTLSSESNTYPSDVSQKGFLLGDSTTLEIQPTTTADSYPIGIESTALTDDSPNDVIVLGSEDFVVSTSQDPVYAVTSETVATTTTEASVKGFCAGLEVGIHRHPEKCDGIIRCDGVHTILMPSCPSGLLFNNFTKACDYPTSVPECGSKLANDNSASDNCNGHEHGAHVQDPEDCGVFWRCVWDELVKMECPKGTFFNEMTSVCDWPQAVPTCDANGARKVAADEE